MNFDSLYGRLVLPAFETGIKRRQTFRILRELEATQWQPRERLQELQLMRLKSLLSHAFRYCPYYQDEWTRRGLDPSRVERLEDLADWPVVTREEIRRNRQAMRSTQPGVRLLSKATGGSSGTPLQFEMDPGSNDRRVAASYRGYSWAGAGPGTSQVLLWGVPLGDVSKARRLKESLFHRFHRRRVFNTFDLGPERAVTFARLLERTRPTAVVAYSGALYSLARLLDAASLRPYAPRAILVGAEKLHPHQRETIERVFGCPVFETYGSREFMLIASECERHSGLHLTAEHLIVEVLDDERRPVPPGSEGNLVVTDLFNLGMPFVRYAIGDRGVIAGGTCACGRGLPLLQEVTGRVSDLLTSPDGRVVTGLFFPHLLKDFPEVGEFQVVQTAVDRVELRIVPARHLRQETLESIEKRSREALGDRVAFTIRAVDEIPLTNQGKRRVVVNQASSMDQAGS